MHTCHGTNSKYNLYLTIHNLVEVEFRILHIANTDLKKRINKEKPLHVRLVMSHVT